MLRGVRNPPPQRLTALADAAPIDGAAVRAFEHAAGRLAAGDRSTIPALRAQLRIWAANAPRFAEVAAGKPDLEAALPVAADVAAASNLGLACLDAIEAHHPLDAGLQARASALMPRLTQTEAAMSRPIYAFLQRPPPADLLVAIAPGVSVLIRAASTAK